MFKLSKEMLDRRPDAFGVFGDNEQRKGRKGTAVIRGHPRSFGFITKRWPGYEPDAYFTVDEYRAEVYPREIEKLIDAMKVYSDYTFYIPPLGAGLANHFGIFENVIRPYLYNDLSVCGITNAVWINWGV